MLLAGHTFSGSPRRRRPLGQCRCGSAAAAASNLACHRVAAFCPGRRWQREHRAEHSGAAQRRLSLAGEASTKMCDRLLTNEPPNRGKNDKFAVATAERGNGGSGGSWQRFVAPFNI